MLSAQQIVFRFFTEEPVGAVHSADDVVHMLWDYNPALIKTALLELTALGYFVKLRYFKTEFYRLIEDLPYPKWRAGDVDMTLANPNDRINGRDFLKERTEARRVTREQNQKPRLL